MILTKDNWKQELRSRIDGVSEYEEIIRFIEQLLNDLQQHKPMS